MAGGIRKGKGKAGAPTTQSGTATMGNTPNPMQSRDDPDITETQEGEAVDPETRQGPPYSDVGSDSESDPDTRQPGYLTTTHSAAPLPGHQGSHTAFGMDPNEPSHTISTGANRIPIRSYPVEERPTSNDLFIQGLLKEVFDLQKAGASPESIAQAKDAITLAQQTLRPQVSRPEGYATPTSSSDDFLKRIKGHNPPYLGTTTRDPTTQEVAQWSEGIKRTWTTLDVRSDSRTRNLWAVRGIKPPVLANDVFHHADENPNLKWYELVKFIRKRIQDPVLTQYQDAERLWNITWRTADPFRTFKSYLEQTERAMDKSPFKDDADNTLHWFKNTFVFSKMPPTLKGELVSSSALRGVETWDQFCDAVQDAEQARRIKSDAEKQSRQDSGKNPSNKRPHAGSDAAKHKSKRPFGKGRDNNNEGKPSDKIRSGNDNKRPDRDAKDREKTDSTSEKHKKPHWKNKDFQKDDQKKVKP